MRVPLLSPFGLSGWRICLPPSLRASTPYSVRARALRSCVTPQVSAFGWHGNINPFPIAYAFRPRLRTRLTLLRLALSRNPWAYGGRVFHPSSRYSCLHFLFQSLHRPSRGDFSATGMLPYRLQPEGCKPEASAPGLMPDNFRRRAARPVSCYALFKGMAASKPTSWLS